MFSLSQKRRLPERELVSVILERRRVGPGNVVRSVECGFGKPGLAMLDTSGRRETTSGQRPRTTSQMAQVSSSWTWIPKFASPASHTGGRCDWSRCVAPHHASSNQETSHRSGPWPRAGLRPKAPRAKRGRGVVQRVRKEDRASHSMSNRRGMHRAVDVTGGHCDTTGSYPLPVAVPGQPDSQLGTKTDPLRDEHMVSESSEWWARK